MKAILLLLSLVMSTAAAAAQPKKFEPAVYPIEIVVTAPPGGASDGVARIISKIFDDYGWRSIVVNKPGGDETLAAAYMLQAAPTGHSLLIGNIGSMVSNIVKPGEGVKYRYSDFKHIILFAKSVPVFYVRPELGITNFVQFKTWVKDNPDKYTVGVWANFVGDTIKVMSRLEGLPEPIIVPFKGSAPLQAGIVGGHINFMVDTYRASKELLKSDKLVAIATFDTPRPALVNRSTDITKKYPGLKIPIWFGVVTNSKVPDDVVNKINQVINQGLRDANIRKNLEESGYEVLGGEPKQFKQINDDSIQTIERLLTTQ